MAQNAAGFAFELALETISPVIAETMAKLRALAQWINDRNLNSCETAQALVGAVWSKNDRASGAICAAIGTSQGIFSDYAAAKHGCGSDGKRNSTLASASGAMADQVPVNVNYAWKAVRASSFLSGDTQLAEFAMSVSGTVIVTAPTSDADTSGPRVRVLEPLALDRRVTEILMEGGGQLPVYRCDTTAACLNPTLGSVNVPADRGFRARVAALLRDLVDAVRTDTAPPAAALGLVNLTTLPVYRVANTAAAYRGAVVDQEMDALAEAVALDVLQVWITDLHRTVEGVGRRAFIDGQRLAHRQRPLVVQLGGQRPSVAGANHGLNLGPRRVGQCPAGHRQRRDVEGVGAGELDDSVVGEAAGDGHRGLARQPALHPQRRARAGGQRRWSAPR